MKTVSVGAARAASAGARLTVPPIVAPGNVAACGPGIDGAFDVAMAAGGLAAAMLGFKPPSSRASAMLASIDPAMGEPGGTVAFIRSQYATAPL
jgi:hypothetical protein